MVRARTGAAEVDFCNHREWIIFIGMLWILLAANANFMDNIVLAEDANPMEQLEAKLIGTLKVKSIHSSDGDIIDCVDIYKQPAFNHPALKHHKIQMRPTFFADQYSEDSSGNENNSDSDSSVNIHQTWQKFGSCPDGTIPILRVKRRELLLARASTNIESFGRQHSTVEISKDFVDKNGTARIHYGPRHPNSSTAVLMATSYPFTGARGYLNVWNPRVERDDEYTTSQIWLERGPLNDVDSIQSGWTVNPSLYGDRRTRFFIYWTSDSSRATGCFNLLCPGFVQTSKEIALGAVLEPTSIKQGPQYLIAIEIRRDKEEPKWWLRVQDRVNVGYWPGTLFKKRRLEESASIVKWGGQVHSPRGRVLRNHQKTPHTATAMGSGEFATNETGIASYIFHIRVLLGRGIHWLYPVYTWTLADEPHCYSVLNYDVPKAVEAIFYFGGPGSYLNPRCSSPRALEEYTYLPTAVPDQARDLDSS